MMNQVVDYLFSMDTMHDIDNITSLIEPIFLFFCTVTFNAYFFHRILFPKAKPTEAKSSEVPFSNRIPVRIAILVGLAAYYFGPLYDNTGGLEDFIQGEFAKCSHNLRECDNSQPPPPDIW